VDPGFKERVTAAFDGLASRYDTGPGGFFGPVSELLVQVAGLRPGQAVPDVGCVAGACLFAAAKAVGPAGPVTGIDLVPQQFTFARLRFLTSQPGTVIRSRGHPPRTAPM
jgi:O-methyltransferase / aklanonic acid methyltransferase